MLLVPLYEPLVLSCFRGVELSEVDLVKWILLQIFSIYGVFLRIL